MAKKKKSKLESIELEYILDVVLIEERLHNFHGFWVIGYALVFVPSPELNLDDGSLVEVVFRIEQERGLAPLSLQL